MQAKSVKFPTGNVVFSQKLETLKNKLSPYIENIPASIETDIFIEVDGAEINSSLFTIENPIQEVDGYKYVGTHFDLGGFVDVFGDSNSELSVVAESIKNEVCSHCGKHHKANKRHIFEKNGSYFNMSNTCTKDLLGYDVNRVVNILTNYFKNNIVSDEEIIKKYKLNFIPLDPVVKATVLATVKYDRWISVNQPFNGSYSLGSFSSGIHNGYPTSTYIREHFNSEEAQEGVNAFRAQVAKKLAVKFYNDKTTPDDFITKMKTSLFDRNGELKQKISIKDFGIVSYAIFNAIKKYNIDKKVDTKKESNYVGTVGERIEIKGCVDKIREVDSLYGLSMLIGMRTDEGNIITFFSKSDWVFKTKIGEILKIKGTIKSHKEINKDKTTQINRVKLL